VTFKVGDWVRSARVGSKGSFVGQIVDRLDGDFILRDIERRKWLRKADELSIAKPEKVWA
jgi:hypothetical protein